MPSSDKARLKWASGVAIRVVQFMHTRSARWIARVLVAILLLFTLAGFVLVPHLVRNILTAQVASTLRRPVTVGRVRFNPYTLRMRIDRLRIGNSSDTSGLAEFQHVDVNVSWSSAFHFAPIISELTIDRPVVNIVRSPAGEFNFADILRSLSSGPSSSAGPPKFAISNIRILNGTITFDDREAGQRHVIDKLQLGIPFIANLSGGEDVVVQPLLQMSVDGRPVRISGVSRPFAGTFDSAVNLSFHRINLPSYAGYLPPSVGIKLPSGALSLNLLIHFHQSETGPRIDLSGAVAVDQLDLRDQSNAPVLSIDHGEVKMADVEPLDQVFNLSEIALIGMKANLVRQHDGQTNLEALLGVPSQTVKPIPSNAAAAPAPTASTAGSPVEAGVGLIKVVGGSVSVTDLSEARPATTGLQAIESEISNLRLHGQVPASFDLTANLQRGGAMALKGTLDLAASDVKTALTLDQIDLPSLQAFAQSAFAGTLKSGKFTAHGEFDTHFASGKFNIHAQPADAAIDNLEIDAPGSKRPPLAWNHFGVSLDGFDLASRQIDVKELRADGIKVYARRERRGTLNLAGLIKTPSLASEHESRRPRERRIKAGRSRQPLPNTPAEPPWQYKVESIAIEKTELRFIDLAVRRFVRVEFSPLNLHVKGLTSDFAKPFSLEADGVRNHGSFRIEGTAAINPLKADLQVDTRGLYLSEVDNYADTALNADIISLALTVKGDLGLAQHGSDYRIKYEGSAAVGDFAAIDKLTGDRFVNWKSLSIAEIAADIGDGPPKIRLGETALSDFYARIILNGSGKLNLNDVTASPNEQPKSLTREESHPKAQPAATATPTPAGSPSGASIQVDGITLKDGHIDYTDDFIKPHYSADLAEISGSVGAFGTGTQEPAVVQMRGQVNGSSPVRVSGKINPLAPAAFVDLRGKAEGIELTGLSPYSTKYTGYPIVKGTLTARVHYLLQNGELTANNHLFINQLTFGERVENNTALNLPVRFAVDVLKNSRGEINLHIPVSGSLSDPQFSIGSVVWGAFVGVLKKAVTSPFSLLASTVNGVMGAGGSANLSYVAFDPGRATLTDKATQKLTTLGNALRDHPAPKLSICGRVDPERDLQGLREVWLEDQIRAQKIRREGGAGDPQSVKVTPADYDKYLARAYSHAKIPKPRDFIGLAKTLPPEEMKKLMLENAPVSSDALSRLADARANVVRQYLSATVKPGRLFIVPPRLDTEGIEEGPTTRVDLSLQ